MSTKEAREWWASLSESEALDYIQDKEEESPTHARDLENATLRRPSVLYAANEALYWWAWGCGYESRATKYRRRAKRWLPLVIQRLKSAVTGSDEEVSTAIAVAVDLCMSDLAHALIDERARRERMKTRDGHGWAVVYADRVQGLDLSTPPRRPPPAGT